MFKRVLICTDFTDSLPRLVNFVADLAKGGIEHVVFFHSVPLMTSREIPCVDEEKVAQARQMLSVAESNVPEGMTVDIDIASGRDSENIIRAVTKHNPDIILSGMATRSELNERVFGSTTMEIVDKVKVPLMVLRPQLVATYRESELALRCQHLFDYLLIPYDGSDSSNNLISTIKGKLQAEPRYVLETCLLCWVVDDGGRFADSGAIKAAQAQLNEAKAELETSSDSNKPTVITEVRIGNPLDEILKSGEVHDISAIAVCSSKGGGLLRITPSFTNAILRSSWHPVVHFPS
ncbi:MAG: universal stress protein [Cyanobacteria bacterium P01_D01_bin.105]